MQLWGLKTISFFDVWSFEHLLSGMSIGNLIVLYIKKHFSILNKKLIMQLEFIYILALSYMWETFEHYCEIGLLGYRVKYWFYGVEDFYNRFFSDGIIVLLGYLIIKKYPKYVNRARIISFIFLYVHIFIFPNSMFLHLL